MKKICMIIPHFGFGGAEKSFCALSVELSKIYDITVIVFNEVDAPVYAVGGKIISLNVDSSSNWLGKLINFIKRIVRLKQVKKRISPDVSISFLEGADYINILSSIRENILLSVRGSKIYDQNISGVLGFLRHKILIPLLYKKADTIIVLNQGIKNELRTHYHIKKSIEIIHNWIDCDEINRLSKINLDQRFDDLFKKDVIISHGRLAKEKGYSQFLEIFAELKSKNPELKFVLIGDGIEKQHLEAKCALLRLSYCSTNHKSKITTDKNVYFLGYQSNPFKFIAKANAYIFSSLHEGFGNALIEGMACGLPVIASDCPDGPKEILCEPNSNKTKYGFLLKNLLDLDIETINIWANTIHELISNSRLINKYSKYSISRSNQFKKEKMVRKWLSIIDKL